MAEWSIAAVLKTVELRGSWGSNPYLSAIKGCKSSNYDLHPFLYPEIRSMSFYVQINTGEKKNIYSLFARHFSDNRTVIRYPYEVFFFKNSVIVKAPHSFTFTSLLSEFPSLGDAFSHFISFDVSLRIWYCSV